MSITTDNVLKLCVHSENVKDVECVGIRCLRPMVYAMIASLKMTLP